MKLCTPIDTLFRKNLCNKDLSYKIIFIKFKFSFFIIIPVYSHKYTIQISFTWIFLFYYNILCTPFDVVNFYMYLRGVWSQIQF